MKKNMKNYLPKSDESDGILNEIKDKFEQCVVAFRIKEKDGSEGNAIGVKCSTMFLAHVLASLMKDNPVAYELAKFLMEIRDDENGTER